MSNSSTSSSDAPEMEVVDLPRGPREAGRILLWFCVFALSAFAIDRLLDPLVRAQYERTWTGAAIGPVNVALRHTDAQVYFLGSSRARQHLDPDTFESLTGLTAYNAGLEGQSVFFSRILQAIYLHRGARPDWWIVNVDPVDVLEPRLEVVTFLRPWAREIPAARDIMRDADPMHDWKSVFRLHDFNGVFLPMIRNLRGALPERSNGFHGRDPVVRLPERELVNLQWHFQDYGDEIDPRAERILREFIDDAREHGACVLFLTSPYSMPESFQPRLDRQRDRAEPFLERFAREHGAGYVSFNEARYPELRDPDLFIDTGHLNRDGAVRLTELVVEETRRMASICPGERP